MKVNFNEEGASEKIKNELFRLLIGKREVVFICIGTDRSTGDCLGPLIGTDLSDKIKNSNIKNVYTYGTLHQPIHAANLKEKTLEIYKKHPNAFVVGVDASLGKEENIGNIYLKNKPIKPGSGIGRSLPNVGNISIATTVNVGGSLGIKALQSTRLSFIFDLKELIVFSVFACLKIRENTSNDIKETLQEMVI